MSIEIAEIKYEQHNIEQEKNTLEEKHNEAINEIYMLRKSIENLKTMDRKLQSEYESLIKAQEHSKNLIVTLENEKMQLQTELEKYTKDQSAGILMNMANLAKNKIMHELSQYEIESLTKINKADIKSEYAQTTIGDINNILIVKNPNEKDTPLIPRKLCNLNPIPK